MRRTALGILIAAVLGPGMAWGQVAAPSLLPVTPGVGDPTIARDPSFVPVNPAVLAWLQRSEAGLGVTRSERDREAFTFNYPLPSGGTFPIKVRSEAFYYEGTYAGAQLVGERYALAIEGTALSQVQGSEPLSSDSQSVSGAMRLGGFAAVGAGYRITNDEDSNNRSRSEGEALGISLRLFEHFYLGAASGIDHIKQTALSSSGVGIDDGRATTGYGAGFRSDGDLRLHVEVWSATLGAITDKNHVTTNGGTLNAAVAEAGWREFVVGYNQSTAQVDFANQTFKSSVKADTVELTLGVVASRAFAVLFHYGSGKTRFDGGDSGLTFDSHAVSRSLSAVYQF